jgi:hypothetical protein
LLSTRVLLYRPYFSESVRKLAVFAVFTPTGLDESVLLTYLAGFWVGNPLLHGATKRYVRISAPKTVDALLLVGPSCKFDVLVLGPHRFSCV